MKKKVFVVMVDPADETKEPIAKFAILAEDQEKAREILKEEGPQHHVFDRGYGIYYHWPITGQTRCQLVELPILDAEKVPA